ncbi:MAG: hypothetical protein WBP13_02135 [Methylophilaceae bacterium]
MSNIERIELEKRHAQIAGDVKKLVEKYRAIFEWDIPDVDEAKVDKLIIATIRKALEGVEKELLS